MREVADADRIRRFMRALAEEAEATARVYFAGGATAVLIGWRSSTIDVDIKIVPEHDHLFRAIPRIKETLQINVELACPADFIPVPPGWEERSPFIVGEGRLFFHPVSLPGGGCKVVPAGCGRGLWPATRCGPRLTGAVIREDPPTR